MKYSYESEKLTAATSQMLVNFGNCLLHQPLWQVTNRHVKVFYSYIYIYICNSKITQKKKKRKNGGVDFEDVPAAGSLEAVEEAFVRW